MSHDIIVTKCEQVQRHRRSVSWLLSLWIALVSLQEDYTEVEQHSKTSSLWWKFWCTRCYELLTGNLKYFVATAFAVAEFICSRVKSQFNRVIEVNSLLLWNLAIANFYSKGMRLWLQLSFLHFLFESCLYCFSMPHLSVSFLASLENGWIYDACGMRGRFLEVHCARKTVVTFGMWL